MNIYIEKLKISNFLSFLGEFEVNFKPHTAIMCNFYEGKDDFLRVLEFVFGAHLSDLRVEKPLDLVHKVLKDEFLVNRDIHIFVEVILRSPQTKNQHKLCRSIKNGVNNVRIEHKVSDLVTSSLLYEEKLSSLGVHIKQKNLIFYKSYFNNAIWGTAEDLEETICKCLRESYLLEDWKRANKHLEYLIKLKNYTAVKNYNSMKKSHLVIANFTKKFEAFCSQMEVTAEEILKSFKKDFSNESSPSSGEPALKEISPEEATTKKEDILPKIYFLTEELDELKLREAFFTSHLHHQEIKLASKPVNASILQNRISIIKARIQEKENQMLKIGEEMQAVQSKVEDIDQKICFTMTSLEELQVRKFRENRLTQGEILRFGISFHKLTATPMTFLQYGRFNDYLQPSRYVQLLKQIVGSEIFYSNLCDSVEDAFALLMELKDLEYEHREVFLPFENYSHKLKDIIIASGEKGIQINTLEELLIFLCKLKHYQVVDEVPVILQKEFNFENVIPNDYTIYFQNNFHFKSDGLISLKTDEKDFYLENEVEMEKNLIHLYKEEEINYRKKCDLLFRKSETLFEMNSLENDVACLKQKWRKSTQKPQVPHEPPPITDIYEEYSYIFKEYAEKSEMYESEVQQGEESFLSERESSGTSSNEESINGIVKDLDDVVFEKRNIQKQLEDLTLELQLLNAVPICDFRIRRNFIKFQNNLDKTRLFFEKEFKKLKKLIKEDDLEDFLGSQEWRNSFIASLIKEHEKIKNKLKTSEAILQNIATERKRRLYQLFEHCSRHLTNTFSLMLGKALPFVTLDFDSREDKIYIKSCLGEEKINVVDIKHFNTLLKFMSVFSVFLEIARFDKVPFIIIDDIEEYFPLYNDNLEAVLGSNIIENILPESENSRFHLLTRLGQFLHHYIKKNTPGKPVRSNGGNADFISGPVQIIYFARDDFIHAAEHYIWIKHQILVDEYISENCNSYSEIHEINTEHLSK